jgi:cation:H+ antiporter
MLLVLGFVLLIKGADFLVEGAASLGRRMGVSDLVIGLTVVAFGTSSPELFVNLIASAKGNTGIAIGNILGSNIANIFLILGVSSIIYPLGVGKGTVWKEIPLSLLAACLLGVLANDQFLDNAEASLLTRIDGIVLFSFFIVFLYYSFSIAGRITGIEEHVPPRVMRTGKSVLFIFLGLAGLALGGDLIVRGAVHAAAALGMSESVVGLTIVAVGTSLPELATSAVAAAKKNVEIAVGNVVGSNIFNIFFVLAISASIRPLPFDPTNNVDVGMVVVGSVFLFSAMFTGRKRTLDRWEGVVLIAAYVVYLAYLISRG